MNILLIGEYNRTHLNIKKSLETINHKCIVISNTDGFKNVEVDYKINEYHNSLPIKMLYQLKLGFLATRISGLFVKRQLHKLKEKLSNFDIVQFVNEAPFNVTVNCQIKIINNLRLWNPKAKFYLLSCGLDHISVNYAYQQKFKYSILSPYFEGRLPQNNPSIGLRYLLPKYKRLHLYIFQFIEGVIANDLDYHIPLINHPKYLGMIPHAIDLSSLSYKPPLINDKIIIFHGINTFNYYKKGNDIFDKALSIVNKTHNDKIQIISVQNLPYKKYIEALNNCHILLDQIYAYDQGFNALEAMAKGKVVFTGAELEWEKYYNLKTDTVAINALPDAQLIAEKLIWLINNPEHISKISSAARAFVAKHHDHKKCAEMYIKIWKN